MISFFNVQIKEKKELKYQLAWAHELKGFLMCQSANQFFRGEENEGSRIIQALQLDELNHMFLSLRNVVIEYERYA